MSHVGTVGTIHPSMLHDIGDVMETGVLTIDRDRIVRGWNRWLEIASGRAASGVVGQSITDLYPEFRNSAGDQALTRAFEGRTSVLAHRFHEAFLRFPPPPGEPDFERMQQSTRIMPHIDQDGEIIGAIALIKDVTERVARERELRQALKDAETANRSKSNFLASMSHELRTPLGGISGYADLLLAEIGGPLTDVQRHHVGRIKTVSSHVLSIVDEILAFARLQAGREQVNFAEIDAVALAREAAMVVEPAFAAKGLKFNLAVPAGPFMIVTDQVKARQILINLLGNAVKFVEQGSVTLRLSIAPDDNSLAYEVADTGPGISAENTIRVFEPFTQVDESLTRRAMGTGLGLPVSRQLARLIGGDLTLRSEVGVGSAFVLTLPRQPSELVAARHS